AIDYSGVMLSTDSKKLTYGLLWNDVNGSGHGEFNLAAGAALNIGVVLADNSASVSAYTTRNTGWDGKSLTKSGAGTLILGAKNTYSGNTLVNSGTLKLGVVDAITTSSGLSVMKGAVLNFGGNNQTISNISNSGTLLINDVGMQALAQSVIVKGNMTLNKEGSLMLNNCTTCAGQTWTQDGNWSGNGGTVFFGTVLGTDSSKTDKLIITGKASGTTLVNVTNKGGTGAQTLEGIELITTGSSDQQAFVQSGRIVAGGYDYRLQQGTASGQNTNNWYLTSIL
ncbi:TPA: autotransporter outer membrane beta-barrel domain-containing protein, partial [Escherichia coli]|nr:autotransporter outer membrane beta-barrel domain-containing protein [Escherichia coli]